MAGGVSNGQKCEQSVLNGAFRYSDFELTDQSTAYTIANNQSSPANVIGLVMDNTTYRSRKIIWQVYRKSTSTGATIRVQWGEAVVWWDDTQWNLTQLGMTSVDAGVVLDVNTSTGQVTYTSDNQAGTYSSLTSVLKYYIANTMGL
jgi:hypothetical protein